MNILLILAVFIIFLLLVIVLRVTYKNRIYIKEIQKFDDADSWYTLAYTDELTGIYNRNAYNKYISEIEESDTGDKYWIILFDIDDFKTINDTKGHIAGDSVLQSVAKTLSSIFSSKEYNVYRIGGDEFAVVAKNITREQLTDSLFKFREVFGHGSKIKVSMGYSLIQKSVRLSFANADEMLYAVKTLKREVHDLNENPDK